MLALKVAVGERCCYVLVLVLLQHHSVPFRTASEAESQAVAWLCSDRRLCVQRQLLLRW